MLPFPLEAPECFFFLSRADMAGSNWEAAVHCGADEAHLPWGNTCLTNAVAAEGSGEMRKREREGERVRPHVGEAKTDVRSMNGR